MSLVNQFSRKEVMELAGATSNQLQYLERAGLITPQRIWNGKKKPEVYYTWEQLLEIRAIRNLRENTSLQTIRKILELFEKWQVDKNFRNKRIVVINDETFWIREDWSDLGEQVSALKVGDKKGKNVGQYMMIVLPAFQEIVDEVWSVARNSKVVLMEDFKKRAKAKSSQKAG